MHSVYRVECQTRADGPWYEASPWTSEIAEARFVQRSKRELGCYNTRLVERPAMTSADEEPF